MSAVQTYENWNWRESEPEPGAAVIVDLDGVLADASGRQQFVQGPKKNWDAFFDACGDDPLITTNASAVSLFDPTFAVIILTSRPLRVRDKTVDWLIRNGVRWDLLVMRASGDYAEAHDFKRRAHDDLVAAGFEIRLAYDDDPRNVAMYEALGIRTIHVPSGYYSWA